MTKNLATGNYCFFFWIQVKSPQSWQRHCNRSLSLQESIPKSARANWCNIFHWKLIFTGVVRMCVQLKKSSLMAIVTRIARKPKISVRTVRMSWNVSNVPGNRPWPNPTHKKGRPSVSNAMPTSAMTTWQQMFLIPFKKIKSFRQKWNNTWNTQKWGPPGLLPGKTLHQAEVTKVGLKRELLSLPYTHCTHWSVHCRCTTWLEKHKQGQRSQSAGVEDQDIDRSTSLCDINTRSLTVRSGLYIVGVRSGQRDRNWCRSHSLQRWRPQI